MVRFVDENRVEYGVEPICKVLPIAPSTYRLHRRKALRPELRASRVRRDEELEAEVRRVWTENRVWFRH